MITREQIPDVLGHTAYDVTHRKLGEVREVFVDNETGEPEWLTVRTGLFGGKETFVPLQPAELQGDEVILPFRQEQVKDAPKVETEEGQLSREAEARLYQHYGMTYEPSAGTTTDETGTGPGAPPHPQQQPTESPADDAMTRAEEHLRVGKQEREAGRARLRKYVVTDYEEHTVPVRREEVRVEREPITDANRDEALAGPEISEAVHEEVLYEERPVVEKETVPVERVRMQKEEVTEEETVGGDVRREHIETEGTEASGPTEQNPR